VPPEAGAFPARPA